jgi:alpha-glucosidase
MLNSQWLIFPREVEHVEDDRLVASVLAVMVPTTWDETRVLAARAGDYYVVAKRKGTKWFVGAITGSKPQDITISLDFLNQPATLTSFRDGRNAHRIAVDYKKQVQQVTPSTQLKLHLVRNGGWCGSF